jgi:PBP1b-binding outer membrane lipoprotein LpoB
MKKTKKIVSLLILLLLFILLLSACSSSPQDKKVNCENTILTKSEIIKQIKDLLIISDIYFFDCNFNNMEDIKIIDTSYNLSISGVLLYNDSTEKYYIDLNNQASIEIVSNYKIETNSKCFGFSIVSSAMQGKMDHYVNNKLDWTNPTIIYTADTYEKVEELHNYGQITYQENKLVVEEIKVPQSFYPCNLYNACSVEAIFHKIKNSDDKIKILDSPVKLITHYSSFEDKNEEKEATTIKKLISYFYNNGSYSKY